MKQAQKTPFDDLLFSHEILTIDEQRKITGGDFIDDMFAVIFNTALFDLNNPIDVTTLNQIKKDFRDLAGTSVGLTVLIGINNYCKTSGEKIIFDFDPNLADGMTSYISTINHLMIKDPSTYTNTSYNSFWHELYHTYTDMVLNVNVNDPYFNDVAGEVDANLFLMMAAKEYDRNVTPSWQSKQYTVINDGVGVDPNYWVANMYYKQAWDDIIENGNFNATNYNTLINWFKFGSAYGQTANQTTAGQNYVLALTTNNVTDTDLTTLNAYKIGFLFNGFFKNIIWPPDTSGGGGGSYDGSQGQGWATNDFWDWYNNYGPGSSNYDPNQGGGLWEKYVSETTGRDLWRNNQDGIIVSTDPNQNNNNGNQDPYNGMTYGQYVGWNLFWDTMFGGNPAYTGQGWGNGFGASSG